MIPKQEFVDIINRLRKVNDFVDETNTRARQLDDATISDFYNTMSLSISHESIVVELLENMFKDAGTISWWLYKQDYGRKIKKDSMTEIDGTPIDVTTPEKLYDYLIEEGEKE